MRWESALLCVLAIDVLRPLKWSVAEAGESNKLLVIMLDGFRWDYLETLFQPTEIPGFRRIAKNGVQAESLKTDFPSLSYVNYYSLMTGLHAENHGFIHNYMYDPSTGLYFLIGENSDQFNPIWWDEGEPLWVTAKKQGLESYWWYWCGCEVRIRNTLPKFCQPYLSVPTISIQHFSDALDSAVEVLRNGSADLAGVYFGQVDDWGHKEGPSGPELSRVIRQVDAELARLLDALESKRFRSTGTKLSERVNVMIFADHGMTGLLDGRTGVVQFNSSVLGPDDVVIGSTFGPVLQIYTSDEKVDQLFDRIRDFHPHVTVYKKSEIPARFHYRLHRRSPSFLLIADLGYVIGYKSNATNTNKGFHGYDNEEKDMDGIFLATGPDFKKNVRTETLRVNDLYEVMCHVLNIRPSPHNGTWKSVAGIFSRSSGVTRRTGLWVVVVSALVVVLATWAAALAGKI